MAEKPTYDELAQRIQELEEVLNHGPAGEALRKSEERFQAIFEHSPLAIMYTDAGGSITMANDNAVELFGAPREVLIGFSYKQIQDERMRSAIAASLAGNPGHFEGEYLTVTGNVLRQMTANFSPSFAADGSVSGVIGIFEDITSRKQAEDELQKYHHMVAASQDRMSFVDRDYIYRAVNDAYLRTYNKKREEIIGHPVAEVLGENFFQLQVKSRFDQALAGEQVQYEAWFEFPARTRCYLDITYFPYFGIDNAILGVVVNIRDITGRQKAVEELKASEERFRILTEASREGICIHDQGVILDANDAMAKIFGYDRDELIGRNVLDLVAPESLDLLKHNIATNYEKPYEVSGVKKDGSILFGELSGKMIPYRDGTARVVAVRDLTEHKRTVAALKESEEKYRKLFTNDIDAICIFEIETGRILDVNQAFLDLYGYTREEVLLLTAADMSAEPEQTKAAIKKSATEGSDTLIRRRRHRKKDGAEIVVELSAGPFIWNERQVMYAIIRDITEHVRAEQALAESENKFKTIVQACPMGIFLYKLTEDDRLIFMDTNPAANHILGVDCREFVGKTLEESLPSLIGTELPEGFRRVCRTGQPWYMEQFAYQEGPIKGTYEVHAFQTAPGMMAALFTDITRKQQMEEEVQKIHKLESVGILAGGIAHDFNNLLTAIMGNISMAKMLAAGNEQIDQRLSSAEKASVRAQDLTQQLLTFSKGGAPVRRSASIQDLIADSISFTLSGSNVKCELEMVDHPWPVLIDQGQISQVIQNIVKNAEQAMPKGGRIMIRVENITLGARDLRPLVAGRYVLISIADQGEGIPEKYLASIFDPYFSTKQEGSGLGLAVAHSIVQKHDGLLTAQSEPGAGAMFRIYLPAAGEAPTLEKKEKGISIMSGGRILVVDDEKAVLKVAGDMLRLMGYEAEVAWDGSEAVAMYREAMGAGRPFAAVLLDLTIPGGMGGLETVRQLRVLDPGVKAIVSSGYANDPVMADFAGYGFSGMVAKPYTMQKLGETLKMVLSGQFT